jgi:Cu-Zn family superoxide dismutase
MMVIMFRVHRTFAVAALAASVLAATACSAPPAPKPGAPSEPSSSAAAPSEEGSNPDFKDVSVTFGQDDAATNYDAALVPNGAKLYVAEVVHDGLTTVVLDVRGLVPNRQYGAHAHAKPCGPKPEDAGPHFQHSPDPVKPSVDPAFANPQNEIWLDFVTDAKGNATKATTVDWTFGNTPAGAVVIHAEPTKTAPGQAGVAGARAACVSVGF